MFQLRKPLPAESLPEDTDGEDAPPPAASRCGSLLRSPAANVRSSDDVIAFEGHMQPLCVSYPAIVTAAGFAWSTRIEGHAAVAAVAAVVAPGPDADAASGGVAEVGEGELGVGVGFGVGQLDESGWSNVWGEDELLELLDVHVFKPHAGGSLGRIMCDLGNTYLHAGGSAFANRNGTVFFKILVSGAGERDKAIEGASIAGLRAASKHLKHQLVCLDKIVAGESDSTVAIIVRYMRLSAEMTLAGCMLGQTLLRYECPLDELPLTTRTDLANRVLPLLETLRTLWLLENREGGLEDTVLLLRALVLELLSNTTVEKAILEQGTAVDLGSVGGGTV